VSAPTADITRVAIAQRRLDEAIAGLTDADVRRASALPDWTVAHVLTHVARNADSHTRRTEAARRNEMVDQYPGGWEGREAEIDAGAGRTAAELITDVRVSAEKLAAGWLATPESAWSNVTRDVGGRERPLADLVLRRWQELEVHLVDLDIGITYRDWPDDFVTQWLPRLRQHFSTRPELSVDLDEHDELAWLYGRLQRAGLPVLPSWG
jgi:maleylpyruvate isomerase